MDYHCQRSTKFDLIATERRSTIFPHLKIKFNFIFQTEHSNYILNQNSQTSPQFLESLLFSNYTIDAVVTAQTSLSPGDVQEKLEKAIGGRLLDHERRRLITRAWREVREILLPAGNLPLYTILYLDFKIWLTHSHVYVVEGHTCPRMVSAAAMVEECCICLEEIGGAAAAMMPCSHVFHGGCIEKWLRMSHFCPLCRYEIRY